MSNSNLRILFRLVTRLYRAEGFYGIYRRLILLTHGYQLDHKRYKGIFSETFINNVNNYSNILYAIREKFRALIYKKILLNHKNQVFIYLDEGCNIFTSLFCNEVRIRGWGFKNGKIATPINLRLKINNEYVDFSREIRLDVLKNLGSKIEDQKIGFVASCTLKKYFNIIKIQYLNNENKWKTSYAKLLFNVTNQKFSVKRKKLNYAEIKKKRRLFLDEQIKSIKNHISMIDENLHFEIHIKNADDYKGLKITLDSLDAQIYKKFSIHINEGDALKIDRNLIAGHCINPSLPKNLNIFWMAIPAGYVLELNALYEFFNAYIGDTEADLIYADEDYLVGESYANPFYKPDWSPDYLETFNYIGDIAIYRPGKVDLKYLLNNSYDFVLRYTELTNNVLHIKKVLGGGPTLPGSISLRSNEENVAALNGRLKRTNRQGNAKVNPEFYGSYFFNINLREKPLVSIVIPTAGKVTNLAGASKDLICNVVTEIFSKSTYADIEVIVVDGGELLPSQVQLIQKFGCRRILHSNEKFNYSNSCNIGANIATGEILIFLNDDIEIITPSWIEGIVAQFEKPHVGVVGCQLLYPNGLLQHVGVVHNKGCPDHVMDGMLSGVSGYFYSVSGVRNYQAVTGACQAVPKKLFFDVGGYSEDLAVCFNDTDLCMKIARHSKYVVYDGGIKLIHMTSQSRSSSAPLNIDEINLYQEKWKYETVEDPFYNEKNLSILRPTFEPEVNLDTP